MVSPLSRDWQTEDLCIHAECLETALDFSGCTVSGLAFLYESIETACPFMKGSSSLVFAWLITSLLVLIDPTILKPMGFPDASAFPYKVSFCSAKWLTSVFFRLLDEARLSATDITLHDLFPSRCSWERQEPCCGSQVSLCCCFGAEYNSSLRNPGCGHWLRATIFVNVVLECVDCSHTGTHVKAPNQHLGVATCCRGNI